MFDTELKKFDTKMDVLIREAAVTYESIVTRLEMANDESMILAVAIDAAFRAGVIMEQANEIIDRSSPTEMLIILTTKSEHVNMLEDEIVTLASLYGKRAKLLEVLKTLFTYICALIDMKNISSWHSDIIKETLANLDDGIAQAKLMSTMYKTRITNADDAKRFLENAKNILKSGLDKNDPDAKFLNEKIDELIETLGNNPE